VTELTFDQPEFTWKLPLSIYVYNRRVVNSQAFCGQPYAARGGLQAVILIT